MPLRIATANLDFNLPGDAEYIAHLCDTSDVVLVQEAKNVRLVKVAPVGFTALQDTTDQAHMGTGILVRNAKVEVGRHGATLGVKPILRTGRRVKMLARYIYSAHLTDKTTNEGFLAVSAHFPPRRFLPLQRPFRNALAGVLKGHAHSVTGTDANQPITNVAKKLGLTAKGQGIVGLLGGKGVTVSKMHVAMWGVQHKVTDHPSVAAEVASVVVRQPAPAPYGKTEIRGHTLDNLTDYALLAVEAKLNYRPRSLTVVQGSYNAGGVGASAGTHDGGGAVDLTPVNWQEKVHALRAVGFAAWHRPALPGVWGEHIHCILIGNAKLSPAAAAQVVDYRNHRDGLAGHAADNTWHPDPIPTFHMPKFAE